VAAGSSESPQLLLQLSVQQPAVELNSCSSLDDEAIFNNSTVLCQEYPLGKEHWINQPVAAGSSESLQLLLQLSVQQPAVELKHF
jgi:hypothetical protein